MKRLFNRILVPFDFSPQSQRALAAACDLTETSGGEITVLSAIAPITSLAGIRPPGGPVWLPPDDLVAAEQQRLRAIAERIAGGSGQPRMHCRVVVGEPLPEILSAARRADSIVMATTGRGALSHALIGSVAERVVRHAPVPVLTIGPQAARRLRSAARCVKREASRVVREPLPR